MKKLILLFVALGSFNGVAEASIHCSTNIYDEASKKEARLEVTIIRACGLHFATATMTSGENPPEEIGFASDIDEQLLPDGRSMFVSSNGSFRLFLAKPNSASPLELGNLLLMWSDLAILKEYFGGTYMNCTTR